MGNSLDRAKLVMLNADDLLGRRIATFRAETEGDIVPDYQATKGASIHYDYYGLSQRVAMVRQSPFSWQDCEEKPCDYWLNNGDKFLESYTYSPVGPVVRTDEGGDVDDGNNIDHWVAADLWGGTTSLLLYTGEESDRVLACQHFDAWGVRVGTDSSWSTDFNDSRYRWRSQEGSETDDLAIEKPLLPDVHLQPPSLVYMQSRHYDPGLGRFIMADSIPMGAFSPQGLNRYAYCLNDPVNGSDPSGTIFLDFIVAILAALGFFGRIIPGVPNWLSNAILGTACLLKVIAEFLKLTALQQRAVLSILGGMGEVLAVVALVAVIVLALLALTAWLAKLCSGPVSMYALQLDLAMYELDTNLDVSPYVMRWRDRERTLDHPLCLRERLFAVLCKQFLAIVM